MTRTIATMLAAGSLLVAAAGCGGTSNGVKGAQTTNALPPKAQVRQNWVAFFNASTPASEKAKLLQNGQKFAPVIKTMSKSPLAKKTAAKVKSVTLHGPSKAAVVYSVTLGGKPALRNQTGIAVKTNGVWKVGDQSFCALLGLQGAKPAGCGS